MPDHTGAHARPSDHQVRSRIRAQGHSILAPEPWGPMPYDQLAAERGGFISCIYCQKCNRGVPKITEIIIREKVGG